MNVAKGKGKAAPTFADEFIQTAKECWEFYNKCERPKPAAYWQKLKATMMGVLVMGFIGYMIKLIFIPINNIILSN